MNHTALERCRKLYHHLQGRSEKGRCWEQGRLCSSLPYLSSPSQQIAAPNYYSSYPLIPSKIKKPYLKKNNKTKKTLQVLWEVGGVLGWVKQLKREGEGWRSHHCFCCRASFLAASCSNCVSTSSAGNCTYRTTEPRMKQFFTDN